MFGRCYTIAIWITEKTSTQGKIRDVSKIANILNWKETIKWCANSTVRIFFLSKIKNQNLGSDNQNNGGLHKPFRLGMWEKF